MAEGGLGGLGGVGKAAKAAKAVKAVKKSLYGGVGSLATWPAFVDAIRARLEKGREIYGDRSFTREPAELRGEIEEELLDVCARAFVLWCRVRALEARR